MIHGRNDIRKVVNDTFEELNIKPTHFYADTRKTVGIEGRDMKWHGISKQKAKKAVVALNTQLQETQYLAVVTRTISKDKNPPLGIRVRTRRQISS